MADDLPVVVDDSAPTEGVVAFMEAYHHVHGEEDQLDRVQDDVGGVGVEI